MKFKELGDVFNNLESTSKRLEKILILRRFFLHNKKEAPLLFDMIASNFQREINKKNLGISLKTIFSVIAFVSKSTEKDVEKSFNKIGDIGEIAVQLISEGKQSNLLPQKELEFEDIINCLNKIGSISGKDSNKVKKELLSKLFLSANSKKEYKFLARMLIDDLRIGVSVGVLREVCVNTLFPRIAGIHLICPKCSFISLNLKECFKCKTKIDLSSQDDLILKKRDFVEIGTPKGEIGLEDYFDVKDNDEQIKFSLRVDRDKYFIKTQNPRYLYNVFLSLFERKYNLSNSFRKVIKDISYDLKSVLNFDIEYGTPIKSMLGTRVNNIDDAFEVSKKPGFIDFKYDGLRVQIHNNKGEVKLFSRNLDNITSQFPEVVDYIKTNFSDLSFVVDSECVAYDFDEQKFLEFQILSRRILAKKIDDVKHIKVIVKIFDIMKLNDETLIEKSYKDRRDIMENLLLNRELKQELCFDIDKLKKMKPNFEY